MHNKKVEEYYILYFDVLGYKDIIGSDEDGFLKKMLAFNYRAKEKNWSDFNIVTFSDNVLVAISTNKSKALSKLCHHAARIQEIMLRNHEVILRGAITCGKLYIEKNFVFGTGLVKVVELEAKPAKFPRIIIDKDLNELEYVVESKNTIWEDEKDNHKFINYLNYYHPAINTKEERKANLQQIKRSTNNVIAYMKEQSESSSEPKISLREKAEWLEEYTNKVIKQYGL